MPQSTYNDQKSTDQKTPGELLDAAATLKKDHGKHISGKLVDPIEAVTIRSLFRSYGETSDSALTSLGGIKGRHPAQAFGLFDNIYFSLNEADIVKNRTETSYYRTWRNKTGEMVYAHWIDSIYIEEA